MLEFFRMFLSKTWEFFQIQWPGFDFSIGDVFLASAVTIGAFTALMKMAGVSVPSFGFLIPHEKEQKGGNNGNIKISEKRKGDTK